IFSYLSRNIYLSILDNILFFAVSFLSIRYIKNNRLEFGLKLFKCGFSVLNILSLLALFDMISNQKIFIDYYKILFSHTNNIYFVSSYFIITAIILFLLTKINLKVDNDGE